ncbi:MAG: glycosyltransferase [Candidatus Delongbacteria bacterium]|jgi:mannosylfructose-phosphate synthase|nr:glycosyltransferase [Candidatus Delongbacteria bacterium]
MKVRRIAMLSTHGYFDPVPKLGQTDTGGQVVYVLELAKAIATMGYKVDIYTRWFDKNRQQIDPVPENSNVRVIRIPCGPWEFVRKEDIYEYLPELSKNMIDFIKKEGLDYELFHGHYVDAGIVTLEVANAFGKPVFFTAHSLGAWKQERMGGNPEEMEKKYRFDHRISEEKRIFEAVEAQTVTSDLQHEKLKELYDFTGDNVSVIPPGVNIHRYLPSDEEGEEKPKDIPDNYIFCLSRIDSNKGHAELLRAFAEITCDFPEVHLVIGGGSPNPGPVEKEVRAQMSQIIKEEKLDDKVTMTGYIADDMVVPYYQNALFFVLPSKFEPFGMTSQEAMACGKCVLASRFGGIRNVINNGYNGILMDPGDKEEFANAMRLMLRNPEMVSKIGMKSFVHILKHFSWEAIAQKSLDVYEAYGVLNRN